MSDHVALVVDDSPETLGMVNDALDGAGISVLLALDGSQALAISDRIRPDIVLLDALMPHMDGFETCRRLKQKSQFVDTPVIFMTGLSDTDSVLKGLEAGGIDFLTKPIDTAELIARMKAHLGTAKRTRSVRSALDRLGQSLFGLRSDGTPEWATELTHEIFTRIGLSDAAVREHIYEPALRWVASRPLIGQSIRLNVGNSGVELILLSLLEDDTLVFRLLDSDERSTPGDLRRELPLTERESEVLYWIAFGKTNREIGMILEMSPRTVNKHLETVFPKLGVENRTAAAAVAIRVLERRL